MHRQVSPAFIFRATAPAAGSVRQPCFGGDPDRWSATGSLGASVAACGRALACCSLSATTLQYDQVERTGCASHCRGQQALTAAREETQTANSQPAPERCVLSVHSFEALAGIGMHHWWFRAIPTVIRRNTMLSWAVTFLIIAMTRSQFWWYSGHRDRHCQDSLCRIPGDVRMSFIFGRCGKG